MDNSKHDASPGLDRFLTATLGKRDPADTAAFTRALLGKGDLESAAAFAARILGEAHFDPNQPRDERGRWTDTGASRKTRDDKSEQERRREILKALAPKEPPKPDDSAARADDNSAIFGKRTFTSNDGKPLEARFSGFDDSGRVLLKRVDDGKEFAVPLKRFGDKDGASLHKLHSDKGFMAGLRARPANVHLDSSSIRGVDPSAWETQVIRDIGKLSELETGRAVLDAAKRLARDQEIMVKRQSSGGNKASGGTVYYDPGRTIGARAQSGSKERPPFIGLGQELHNAVVNLSDRTLSLRQREEGGLRVGQQLRVEYNETIRDDKRLKELTDRYPSSQTGYAGWGTKEVDERVLDLEGRPILRRRDR